MKKQSSEEPFVLLVKRQAEDQAAYELQHVGRGSDQDKEQSQDQTVNAEPLYVDQPGEQTCSTEAVSMPSQTADWFNHDSIHPIEQKSLPEFFKGFYPSKTPANYKEYRDFMISLYQASPHTYLTATTCRRHLSGDVCAILRVHAFLEKWGLINFTVAPDQKPHNFALLKESTYNKVLVNTANKQFLTKNEQEYMGNIFDANQEPEEHKTEKRDTPKAKAMIDQVILRKINLLTAKKRPFCGYCNALVGFTWKHYEPVEEQSSDPVVTDEAMRQEGEENDQELKKSQKPYDICMSCFRKEQYPQVDLEYFTDRSLSKEHWEQLQSLEASQINAKSGLTAEQKSTLIMAVIGEGQDQVDWKAIATSLNLKGSKEAREEFFKLDESDLQSCVKYHKLEQKPSDMPSRTAKQGKLEEIAPFCEIDNYFFQCDMLKNFAANTPQVTEPVLDQQPKKRLEKSKRKLATKMMLAELKSMKTEFSQLINLDNSFAKINNEYRNLQSQLFSERISMTTAGFKANN